MTGPQIAQQLALPRSTVGAILRRLNLGKLSALEAMGTSGPTNSITSVAPAVLERVAAAGAVVVPV